MKLGEASAAKQLSILKGAIVLKDQTSAGLSNRSVFANIADNNLTYKSATGVDFVLNRFAQFTSDTRPSASAMGAGARIYDSTLSKPLWSDGSVWKDASGTAV